MSEKYPNARDCDHGHLRRSCETCQLEARIRALEGENYKLATHIRSIEASPSLNSPAARREIRRLEAEVEGWKKKALHYLGHEDEGCSTECFTWAMEIGDERAALARKDGGRDLA